jgi:hypothetical protein
MPPTCWLTSSLSRIFPLSEAGSKRKLTVLAARGERVSFQACIKAPPGDPLEVAVSATAPDDIAVRIRRVGCVPVPHFNTATPLEELDGVGHIPGFVPDPLFDEPTAVVAGGEAQSFWFTVTVPTDATPGAHEIAVEIEASGKKHSLAATVQVSELALQPRRDFPVTHWYYADALCDWYKAAPFSREFWPLNEAYFRNCVEHGQDTILTPIFTPPTDGVKRPTQLLSVTKKGGKYSFDWTDVKKWIRQAKACGFQNFEWAHLFSQWGVRNALRVYEGQGLDEKLLWPPETGATSDTYRAFLAQFLPEFERFLKAEKLLARSFFHVSDEPHGEEHLANYQAARGLLQELAPWMKVMDALSEIDYGRRQITDMPIPSIGITRQYAEEGIPSWTYFCCGPRGTYLNRLLDTPLPKTRMAGWLFYRFQRLGFLHWGYNYWYKSQTRQLIDPFTCTDGAAWPGWAYGDTSLVYPGESGPIDSIRHEVFAESLQDYALLQTASVEPGGKLLSPLVDFNDFPKDETWIVKARKAILG